jgi:hypothetical protein
MATKSRGIGRGGPRPGGGRPKGAKNKKTILAEVLPRLAEQDQQLPLYRLLDRIADLASTNAVAMCCVSACCHICMPDWPQRRLSR